MSSSHEEAARWLAFAEDDLETARQVVEERRLAARIGCSHAQQAAEKALKAVLVLDEVRFSRTHDLDALRNVVAPTRAVAKTDADLSALAQWATEARYPGDWPDATYEDAAAAVSAATKVVEAAAGDMRSASDV
jgi:HEPN domain-containing protein